MWSELDALVGANGRPVATLITVFFHSRSADEVRERYDARVFASEASLERIECEVTDPFAIGEELPGGLAAHDTKRGGEVSYWIPEPRAVAVGDVLLGSEGGDLRLCPPSWIGDSEEVDATYASIRNLLDLPIEMLLVSHGEPVFAGGRDALAAALS
jgi:glyoxylase-like metal-dependent hydrolase (beta-lactamase superfamily II)